MLEIHAQKSCLDGGGDLGVLPKVSIEHGHSHFFFSVLRLTSPTPPLGTPFLVFRSQIMAALIFPTV